ncbi:HupE/UreJ family protein [Flavobacterium agrisoli]|uniref:HupE/UreJ family protein n=1 Tax=Flavobacterium agrisoli TaxID=2793066 RepID=A0A934PPM3_9FLAO|nr:HupE/UreJ family protein [Flavobacterium agrisoli]MBK0371094.1 HupE/UreJ family protein [Flavobacterium agrisoli]
MSEFWIYFQFGLQHVLNFHSYHHVLFLIALAIPYAFKDWKRMLLLVTVLTVGHFLALLLSLYGVINVKSSMIVFLISITILITAFFNLFTAGKSSKTESVNIIFFVSLFFGVIQGLGYAAHFKNVLARHGGSKLLPLAEFELGIEAAQIVVVLVVLILSYLVQTVFRFSKRDWTLVMASFIIGVVLPMIIQSEIWNR